MATTLTPEVITKAVEEIVKKRQTPPENNRRLKTGYILMLDVLGFKEMVSKDKGVDFFDLWTGIRNSLMAKKYDVEGKLKSIDIDLLCLSDTLIVCLALKEGKTNVDPKLLLSIFPQIIDTFFFDLFKKKIFLRGAISFGEYRCDINSNIVMGKALDEAYEWHEVTDWIGVILSPSAKYAMEKCLLISLKDDPIAKLIENRFINYNVPFKNDLKFSTYSYVWFRVGDTDDKKVAIIDEILGVLSEVKYSLSIITKYENTINFVKSLLSVDMQKYKDIKASKPPSIVSKNQ